ncbi:hypothetical protein C8Q74DRAFT_1363616 [Fomes fomentarius]|nr:hypothetical protein C8Q74DRAFT_1363616 [Fomes fomentarius]
MELASTFGAAGLSPLDEPYPIIIPSFEETYGAILVGTFVTFILYGLSVHQTYCYARLYPSDTVVLKLIVLPVATATTFILA